MHLSLWLLAAGTPRDRITLWGNHGSCRVATGDILSMAKRRAVRPGPITKDFAARLRAAREKRGWSQTTLAKKSGLIRQRLVYFEHGNAHPGLIEVEQLASTLGVKIETILGIEPAAHPAFPRQMLEDLARHLRGAADGLDHVLRSVADQVPLADEVKPSKRPTVERAAPLGSGHAKADPWPWIISSAQQLLEGDPRRAWNRVELCDALKAQGVRPVNTRGMHMAIMPRLRAAGLIVEKANGSFTAAMPNKAAKASTPENKERKPAKAPGASRHVPPKPEKSASADALVAAAKPILDADPARSWKPIEFVHALRSSGVRLASWRGVHFYLPKLLAEAGLIQTNGDGKFVAADELVRENTVVDVPLPALLCNAIYKLLVHGERATERQLFMQLDKLVEYLKRSSATLETVAPVVDLERKVVSARGANKQVIEERIFRSLGVLADRWDSDDEPPARVTLDPSTIEVLGDKTAIDQGRVALLLVELCREVLRLSVARDAFNSKRKALALELLGVIGNSYDVPDALDVIKEAIGSGKDIVASAGMDFYLRYLTNRSAKPTADMLSLLDQVVAKTNSRSTAVGALDLQVKTGVIGELEALSRIDEWKEKRRLGGRR